MVHYSDLDYAESQLTRSVIFPGETLQILVYLDTVQKMSGESEDLSPVTASDAKLSGLERKKAISLNSAKCSHFFVKLSDPLLPNSRTPPVPGQIHGEDESPDTSSKKSTHCEPLPLEKFNFDPLSSGGLARQVLDIQILPNGRITILLEIAVPPTFAPSPETMLEVLQFEDLSSSRFQHQKTLSRSPVATATPPTSVPPDFSQLNNWILPPTPSPNPSPSPQLPPLRSTTWTSSPFASSKSLILPSLKSSSFGLNSSPNRSPLFLKGVQGSPGSLAIPKPDSERLSVRCGLQGSFLPIRKWRQAVSVVIPVKLCSLVSDVNSSDFVTLGIQNALPRSKEETRGVTLEVLSVKIESNVAGGESNLAMATPAVHLTPVQDGSDSLDAIQGLKLRPGEEHSVILRPFFSNVDFLKISPRDVMDSSYSLLLACQVSLSDCVLQYRHAISWKPRLSGDIILSVSVDSDLSAQKFEVPTQNLSFAPKVVTIQTTNLTSEELNLTLFAPNSADSRFPFANDAEEASGKGRGPASVSASKSMDDYTFPKIISEGDRLGGRQMSRSKTFRLSRMSSGTLTVRQTARDRSGDLDLRSLRSGPLVPSSPTSFADLILEQSTERSHLWLQSIVPIGKVPPLGTVAVQCEILPLKDGIITLDTLQLASKQKDIFIPETPIQIYATVDSSLCSTQISQQKDN